MTEVLTFLSALCFASALLATVYESASTAGLLWAAALILLIAAAVSGART